MAGIRTTNDGVTAGQTGRFTVGQADGLNVPSTGFVAGLPPCIWMTGGGTAANADPTTIGMNRILDGLTESVTAPKTSWCQPNVRWALGGPGTTGSPPGTPGVYSGSPSYSLVVTATAINDAIAWARAHLGATMDPPILMGVSNGWVCAITYARDNPVTGVIGILPVVAGKDGYNSEDATLRGLGLRERIQDAWHSTFPALPTDPKFSPYDDIANYPNLDGKLWAAYSACDPLLVPQQMAWLARKRAIMHNVGATGHLGPFFSSHDPADNVPLDDLVAFVDSLIP